MKFSQRKERKKFHKTRATTVEICSYSSLEYDIQPLDPEDTTTVSHVPVKFFTE